MNNKVAKKETDPFDLKVSLKKIIRRVKILNERDKEIADAIIEEEDEEMAFSSSDSETEVDEEELKDEPTELK